MDTIKKAVAELEKAGHKDLAKKLEASPKDNPRLAKRALSDMKVVYESAEADDEFGMAESIGVLLESLSLILENLGMEKTRKSVDRAVKTSLKESDDLE